EAAVVRCGPTCLDAEGGQLRVGHVIELPRTQRRVRTFPEALRSKKRVDLPRDIPSVDPAVCRERGANGTTPGLETIHNGEQASRDNGRCRREGDQFAHAGSLALLSTSTH